MARKIRVLIAKPGFAISTRIFLAITILQNQNSISYHRGTEATEKTFEIEDCILSNRYLPIGQKVPIPWGQNNQNILGLCVLCVSVVKPL